MNEERKKVLIMLADGKISADEAERLISALENKTTETSPQTALTKTLDNLPRYLFVKVNVDDKKGDKVRIYCGSNSLMHVRKGWPPNFHNDD